MDLETPVWVYNDRLGAKPAKGRLIRVSEQGFYEVALEIEQGVFQAYLPIGTTVLLARNAIAETESIAFERY